MNWPPPQLQLQSNARIGKRNVSKFQKRCEELRLMPEVSFTFCFESIFQVSIVFAANFLKAFCSKGNPCGAKKAFTNLPCGHSRDWTRTEKHIYLPQMTAPRTENTKTPSETFDDKRPGNFPRLLLDGNAFSRSDWWKVTFHLFSGAHRRGNEELGPWTLGMDWFSRSSLCKSGLCELIYLAVKSRNEFC